MGEAGRIDQVRVGTQRARQAPSDLGGLQGMREAGAREVVVERAHDLSLAGQPTQRAGM